MSETTSITKIQRTWGPILVRSAIVLMFLLACLLIWLSSLYYTERFSQSQRNEAENQISLYSGRLIAEMQRASVVPLLLAQDTSLKGDLHSGDFARSSQRLISFTDEIGAKAITLLDETGRVVAASERNQLGEVWRDQAFFSKTIRSEETVFTAVGIAEGPIGFFYSRKLSSDNKLAGVIVVEVDLDNLFATWSASQATIMVTNSEGIVILSTERQFRNQTLEQALEAQPELSAVGRAIRVTGEWSNAVADAYISGQPLYRLDAKIPFQGWRLTYLSSFDSVSARVNGLVALEITALAVLAALGFYILSRRAIRQSFLFKAESEELRALNEQLSNEISTRERVERDLQVAEQSLAQSSKLAALGEMSAAVSHELNQPLAAMRTYLAGAKLLLQRKRPDEAMSSFQRIDDLIERMGAITRQLKSYARKGGDDLIEVDFRDAVTTSLSMMSPQLGQDAVRIETTLPDEPVMVLADRVRLEQVVVNLLRNGLDAMKLVDDKSMSITMTNGDMASLMVQDNGTGIEDHDNLFEPFFTTKQPGEGVGLGLAISSGIATDLGGRLFARNGENGGAVFEFQLPQIQNTEIQAAE